MEPYLIIRFILTINHIDLSYFCHVLKIQTTAIKFFRYFETFDIFLIFLFCKILFNYVILKSQKAIKISKIEKILNKLNHTLDKLNEKFGKKENPPTERSTILTLKTSP